MIKKENCQNLKTFIVTDVSSEDISLFDFEVVVLSNVPDGDRVNLHVQCFPDDYDRLTNLFHGRIIEKKLTKATFAERLRGINATADVDCYDFLWENEHLGDNVILLGMGGSYAYGTNIETSDIDIRGIALNSKKEILLGKDFENFCNEATDTTIYSVKTILKLLANCNPNTIELCGLKPEHYLYLSDTGRMILNNKQMFLSKRAINSFGGYANQQLWRLQHLSLQEAGQAEREAHILRTIQHAKYDLPKYAPYSLKDINLYLDDSVNPEFEKEIYMDVVLKHYPLRDYVALLSEMRDIVKSYNKVGKRNDHAATHHKLNKHMMHLIRLYLMCFDILDSGEINTYREKEHDFLMEIRAGKYLDNEDKVLPEFFDIVKGFENKLEEKARNTKLPDNPDYDKINQLLMDINEMEIRK